MCLERKAPSLEEWMLVERGLAAAAAGKRRGKGRLLAGARHVRQTVHVDDEFVAECPSFGDLLSQFLRQNTNKYHQNLDVLDHKSKTWNFNTFDKKSLFHLSKMKKTPNYSTKKIIPLFPIIYKTPERNVDDEMTENWRKLTALMFY